MCRMTLLVPCSRLIPCTGVMLISPTFLLELGREEVTHCEAAIGTTALRHLHNLGLGWQVVESVRALHCAPQRKVDGEEHVWTVESNDEEGVCRPRPVSWHFRQCAIVAQASVDEPLRKCPQRRSLAS